MIEAKHDREVHEYMQRKGLFAEFEMGNVREDIKKNVADAMNNGTLLNVAVQDVKAMDALKEVSTRVVQAKTKSSIFSNPKAGGVKPSKEKEFSPIGDINVT
jgi:hypothetical protein